VPDLKKTFPEERLPELFHWDVRFTRLSSNRGKTRRWDRRESRVEEESRRRQRERVRLIVCVITWRTTLKQIASRLDTFKEEIARRTDTSCARSSYPQHPAVAAAAAVAAEGDKAEHARNSVPLRAPRRVAATRPPIHFLSSSSSSRPTRFSSPRSTPAAGTLRSLFCAEIAPSSREFDLTLRLLVYILRLLFGKWYGHKNKFPLFAKRKHKILSYN